MVSRAFPEDWRAFMISFVHLGAETESSAPLVIQPASPSATILNQSISLWGLLVMNFPEVDLTVQHRF
jgi:hypothetical protein